MLAKIIDLYKLLDGRQKSQLLVLQVLVVFMAFAELVGVASIGPFIAIMSGDSGGAINGFYASLNGYLGGTFGAGYQLTSAVIALTTLTFASLLSMYVTWRFSMYAQRVGSELSIRLFNYYLHRPWLFHSSGNSSALINKTSQECVRVTDGIISPLMQMNAKIALAAALSLFLFIMNPLVSVVAVVVFSAAYFVFYRTVRIRLQNSGDKMSNAQEDRFKLMNESFGGIKDILVTGRQKEFDSRFEKASHQYAAAKGTAIAISQVPRYAMELVAFGSVIFIVVFLVSSNDNGLSVILPGLAVYALAGLKLLPAFQQIYVSVSTLRSNMAAFDAIRDDLISSASSGEQADIGNEKSHPSEMISLKAAWFRYAENSDYALKGVDIDVPVNRTIALVGSTGSGKSTVIDMILGIIRPERGALLLDGKAVENDGLRAWQNCIGYVPQAIFLSDSSIRENIAFGIHPDLIDEARILAAAKMAHLDEFTSNLRDGLNTVVGERGVQLSGGQRQRIGIARALYANPEVLVLDEATSALDGITEKSVMEEIQDFSGTKTIILIAHRLTTVKACDCIYMMEAGQVVDNGTYDELISRNEKFKKMALH